jgi:hypothetical protein
MWLDEGIYALWLDEGIYGNLEKSLSLPIADRLGVNVNESERERNGIIRGQFCGVRGAGPIFRGALIRYVVITEVFRNPPHGGSLRLMGDLKVSAFSVSFVLTYRSGNRRVSFRPSTPRSANEVLRHDLPTSRPSGYDISAGLSCPSKRFLCLGQPRRQSW